MILRTLARWNLKEMKLEVVGSALNFCKAVRCRRRACIYSYEFFGEFENGFGIV